MLLFSIPESLSLDLCLSWLRSYDLAKLDSAYCSNIDRKNILNLFEHPHFVIEANLNNENFPWFLHWIGTRKIKLRKLTELTIETEFLFPTLDVSELETLECISFSTIPKDIQFLITLIKKCIKLTSLKVAQGNELFFDGAKSGNIISSEILRNLTTLSIDAHDNANENPRIGFVESVDYLIKHCRQLTFFSFDIGEKVYSGEHLVELFAVNKNLKTIHLWYRMTDEEDNIVGPVDGNYIIRAIADTCPNLQDLSLDRCCNTNSVLYLMEKCVHLEFLILDGEIDYEKGNFLTVACQFIEHNLTFLPEFLRLYCRVDEIYFHKIIPTSEMMRNICYSSDLIKFHCDIISTNVTLSDFIHILSHAKKLTDIHFHNNSISNTNMLELFATVPNIVKELTITKHTSITSEDLIKLVKSIPTLKKLTCTQCFSIDDEAVQHAQNVMNELKVEFIFKKFDIFAQMAGDTFDFDLEDFENDDDGDEEEESADEDEEESVGEEENDQGEF